MAASTAEPLRRSIWRPASAAAWWGAATAPRVARTGWRPVRTRDIVLNSIAVGPWILANHQIVATEWATVDGAPIRRPRRGILVAGPGSCAGVPWRGRIAWPSARDWKSRTPPGVE